VERLSLWRDGPARSAILAYIDRATTSGSAAFVPPTARIAVFDNDGTLWCERPTYPQAYFLLERLHVQAASDPDLAAKPVVRALLRGDLHAAMAEGLGPFADVLLHTHAGLTVDEFLAAATAWFDRAVHPRFGVPFGSLTYGPMLELLDLLRSASFRVFIVTGGGVEFVRAVSDQLYGVSPDDVVGSSVEVAFERRAGSVVLVRRAALHGSPNEGEPKPISIQAHIGQRPIFAAGNSAGDREMLEYATTGTLPSLALVIDHDDETREYAYTGASFTDPHAEPITETASRLGWTTVSMRRDWVTVFGDDVAG
jgi:phosphoglycolate phosphatase-like HAD superfamily hydrolase